MKEILIVTIALGNDGAERVLTELANEWLKKGHKVTIVQTGANNYGCSFELSESAELVNINARHRFKPLRYVEEIISLRKELNKRKNATAISFIVSSIFILAMCKPFIKNKIVVSERNNPEKCPSGLIQRILRNISFEFADVCVFQTEQAKSYFSKRIQKKAVIIPNPINPFLPEMYKGERRKVITTACRLHPQKNLSMLINAFSKFIKLYNDYTLEIYGQGEEREKLQNLIQQLGIESAVKLMGFSSDIHNKIKDCTMYVVSSDYEGISNSMIEAMGLGLPVVATDCPVGGTRMMIKHEENGLLIPVNDEKALLDAMCRLIEDEELRNRISLNAYRLRKQLPIEEIANRWIKEMYVSK